ncbi:phage fiber-tail adaptor protein [Gluconobacter cerinus]|uniref:Uncharacterized protein n=1 Tax=Gluconobacter cerinus TaxID=38307 RepID=A0AAV5NAZ5_9PROT|nr:hypothetical protein [Gluconobacter cerinus]GBR03084.1 hypothetical protein AA0229_1859 [Gluconobacter cerinus NRIC 0229]GLQ61538.1 hypothetical protein GCM10007867_03830 [Gluconobacter cerinus]
MTWPPCQRVVRADVPPSFQVRGINAPLFLSWPNAALNGSADYSVDFSAVLCCGETLADVAFSVSGGTLGWSGKPTFTAGIATAWITWVTAGAQTVEVTALTSTGRTVSVTANITVLPVPALLSGKPQAIAPNILTLPDGTPLTTDAGSALLSQ